MSIPGWLPVEKNTNQGFLDLPLPEEFERIASEGGDGTIVVRIQHELRELVALFEASALNEHVGFDADANRVAKFFFRQPSVFGVLLLDSYALPDIRYETVHPVVFPIDACVINPVTGTPVEYSKPSAVDTVYNQVSGSEVIYDPQ